MKKEKHLIVGSRSPRRHELLKAAGYHFSVRTADVSEDIRVDDPAETALLLAAKKADALLPKLAEHEVLLTADTIVEWKGRILGKPVDGQDARKMLECLSGNAHRVITGVSVHSGRESVRFYDETKVYFNKLPEEAIRYYVDNFRPYDKAGAYGIQEWIGMIGIERIEGSYFNVMGLPVHKVYQILCRFL